MTFSHLMCKIEKKEEEKKTCTQKRVKNLTIYTFDFVFQETKLIYIKWKGKGNHGQTHPKKKWSKNFFNILQFNEKWASINTNFCLQKFSTAERRHKANRSICFFVFFFCYYVLNTASIDSSDVLWLAGQTVRLLFLSWSGLRCEYYILQCLYVCECFCVCEFTEKQSIV